MRKVENKNYKIDMLHPVNRNWPNFIKRPLDIQLSSQFKLSNVLLFPI